MTQQVSQRGVDFIKSFEGYRATAYQDVVGVWTIGYGTTRVDGERVRPGMTCNYAQAEEWLRKDIEGHLKGALAWVKVALTQNQLDAIASFVYNVGVTNFRNSTLLRLLNAGDFEGAQAQFLKWNRAGGKVVRGLVRRREEEAKMFAGE